MKGEPQKILSKKRAQIRQNVDWTPDLEEVAELMNLAGNPTRLKLLYLLQTMRELSVCDLAERLGLSVSATSQQLAKLRAYGLVSARRDAQTKYYSLTEHTFNARLRDNFFGSAP
jgi:DNA-binding transcriptional ArsR family regulator